MTDQPSFFARRRAGLKAERDAQTAPVAAEPDASVDATDPDLPALSDAETLAALDLPDPDTLQREDDFAAFMVRTVPQHLRNRALRSLWRSDTILACVDGLNDYDLDYRAAATGQGVIQTAYRVGRGLLSDPVTTPPAAPTPVAEAVAEPIEMAQAEPEADSPPAADLPEAAAPASEDATPLPPRRMRFQFGDST